ncbi:MAG: hypothetical protein KA534_05000 [Sediminibacterium sp.]|nr:hypothetical protein [Sediminibacterium sp.]
MQYVVVLFMLVLQMPVNAQVSNQTKSLDAAVMQFNQLGKTDAYQQVYTQFEQLYALDKTNWLIPYYASILNARMCLLKLGDRDALANASLLWAARAKMIEINDEIYCAESMANTAKMSVNPTMRWLMYEDKIKKPLQLAKKINPRNPRVYLLEANIQRKLPVLFGGGCKAAIPIAKKAEQYLHGQVNQSNNMPGWGRQSLVEFKTACPF